MSTNKIVLLIIFQFVFVLTYCQPVFDSSLNYHIEKIKEEKFDSIGNLYPVPKFIGKYLKKTCGNGFKIITREDYLLQLRTGHREIAHKVLESCFKSLDYYLISYTIQSDPYSTRCLLICRYGKNGVDNLYLIKNIFFRSIGDLISKLETKKFETTSLCN